MEFSTAVPISGEPLKVVGESNTEALLATLAQASLSPLWTAVSGALTGSRTLTTQSKFFTPFS